MVLIAEQSGDPFRVLISTILSLRTKYKRRLNRPILRVEADKLIGRDHASCLRRKRLCTASGKLAP